MPTRARTALIGAGVSSALLALVWLLAFHTGLGERADQSIFQGFAGLQRPRVNGLATFLVGLCDAGPFLLLSAGIIAVALASRRPRIALAIGVLLIGANVTTELLKPLLAVPESHPLLGTISRHPAVSWPSGHATAAMSLALGLVLAVPARYRPAAAALGALFAVAVSYSFLTLGWHYPSDVLGGFLVAVIWTQLAVAGVAVTDARRAGRSVATTLRPLPLGRALAPAAAAVAGIVVLAGLVALARPHQVIDYASGHAAFIVGAAAIAALAFALSIAVMLSVRR
jgi:membrane-associated phospholipid phosphatase